MMKHFKRCCCMVLAMAIGISSLGMDSKVYAGELRNAMVEDISGKGFVEPSSGNVTTKEADDKEMVGSGSGCDDAGTESVFETDRYKVTFTLSENWDGGYNAHVVIENVGKAIIENWSLRFPYGEEIENLWNAEPVEYADGSMTVRNAGWNRDVPVGGSVSFGFRGTRDFVAFPEKYELVGETAEVSDRSYFVEYDLSGDWGSGFTGEINITNNTQETIEDWALEFDFARTIDNIWCADIASVEAGHYVVRNQGYNADIRPGQKVSFGFMGSGGMYRDEPANYRLYSYGLCENGKNVDAPDRDKDKDNDKDTDGDGLSDVFEKAVGLDHRNADTDGDGLTDYEEIYVTWTDPLLTDTDGNGISDSEEDLDGDGLANKDEIMYGTDIASADTDGDDLTDYEELYIYGTNPLLPDTDGDGLTDYDDVALGFSPLMPDTDGNGVSDADEKLPQTVEERFDGGEGRGLVGVEVSMEVAGNAWNQVAITNLYGVDLLSSDVVGLVGVPVDIHADVEFDRAELVFRYDEAMLGDVKEENLAILWYDEAGNRYRVLDSVVDTVGNTVSYETTHFSTYMLVDSEAWCEAWRRNIDYGNVGQGEGRKNLDVSIVMGMSAGMAGERIEAAKTIASNLVDSLQDGDALELVEVAQYHHATVGFATDCTSFRRIQKEIDLLGATGNARTIGDGLNSALRHLTDRANGNQKVIVLISDGNVRYNKNFVDGCIKDNVKVYAINVTYEPSHAIMEKIAELTGGQYYYGVVDSMDTMLGTVQDGATGRVDTTDLDGDGLRDDVDKHPWRKDFEWVAQLDSGFAGVDYLRIQQEDGSWTNGGDQKWWKDKASLYDESEKKINYENYVLDPYYRLVWQGCGVIAMSNLELYMAQQKAKGGLSNLQLLDKNRGIILKEDYRKYVEDNYQFKYWLNDVWYTYKLALTPQQMEMGMEMFLLSNPTRYHYAKWAPYCWEPKSLQRKSVLKEIESMLGDNVPVVFSYYTSNENDPIKMYASLEEAKDASNSPGVSSHYMTIIGLYKYLDDTTSDTQYILKVESWGDIYYIRYDQYADHLSYATNILRVS